MGTRHLGGAVRHAGARRRDIAQQGDPVFRARRGRARALPLVRQVHIRGAAARLDVGADRRVDTLSSRRSGYRALDLLGREGAIRGQPDHGPGRLPAGADAFGLSFRSAEPTDRDTPDHVHVSCPLLRRIAANGVPGRKHLGRDPAQRSRARRHGDGALSHHPKNHAQAACLRCRMFQALLRILALTRKELLAILKDPRARPVLFVPPALQCLVFGYVATFDLNRVPYAALDRDRTAASHELLADLDGSGVFQRVANLDRAADAKTYIDERRALVVIEIDQDFERRLLAGDTTAVQVIADGRNSNTAG